MKHANSNILFFLKPKVEIAYIYDYHTVRQALEIMEYHKYSSIPILSRDGKYVGSITEGDLLWGLKKLDLGPDELLARIRIPAPPAHAGSFYIKYTRRDAMDLALLGVSAYVELAGGTLKTVRIALTTAAPTPIRAFETEKALTGSPAAEETFLAAGKAVLQESHPRSSWRSSAEFRLALLEELTAQALRQAVAVAKEA